MKWTILVVDDIVELLHSPGLYSGDHGRPMLCHPIPDKVIDDSFPHSAPTSGSSQDSPTLLGGSPPSSSTNSDEWSDQNSSSEMVAIISEGNLEFLWNNLECDHEGSNRVPHSPSLDLQVAIDAPFHMD